MKTILRPGSRNAGSALVLALVAFLFMAGIGGAIFSLSLASQRTTMAAAFGDGAYHVAEAGIDDAINKMRGYMNDATNTSADYAVIGQTPGTDEDGNPATIVTGEIRGGTYSVAIVPPFELGIFQEHKVSSIGTLADERRGINVWIRIQKDNTDDTKGLFGDVYLDAGGNIKTDGYISAKGTYASQLTGPWNGIMVANPTGDIGSNGNVDVSGSSQVYGSATPGPNDTVTGGGTIFGSTTPAKQALTLTPPDFSVPAGAKALSAIIGSETINGGVYTVPSVSPSGKSEVTINGDVTLYIDGDFEFAGQPILNITAGSKLTIYQNSASGTAKFNIAGGSVINADQLPTSLMMYTNTAKGKLTGNSDFYGAIYAPSTAISILGTAGLYGATIAKMIDIQGTPYFHYDESLGAIVTFKPIISAKATEHFVPKLSVVSGK